MPKFSLVRSFSPEMTRAQLDGMALATMAALDTYVYRGGKVIQTTDHGIRWIRSYWEPGGAWGMCLYESPNLDILSDYQELCALPFVAAREVVELDGTSGLAHSEAVRVAVELRLDGEEESRQRLERLCSSLAAGSAGVRFVRAYWTEGERRATALFETTEPERFEERAAEVTEQRPARVIELGPSDYR